MVNPNPMLNLGMVAAASPSEDIAVFANNCVFMRSIYLHGQIMFEASSDKDKPRMAQAASTLSATSTG